MAASNEQASNTPTAHSLQLDIVSLSGALWSGEVRQVMLPGSEGRFGVMARHTPLLTILAEGMLHIRPVSGEPLQIYVCGGYVEVQQDTVFVLADLAARSEDLDKARAAAARAAVGSPLATSLTDTAYEQIHMELLHR
ncbi:ATP synthase F1 subunit epsilon [Xanthomonas populi]|uniref:ATP synthase epsilon chain n=1 Tax=Xanthomonas populi TaxID=53414 RepID=A0A2S7EXC4_9XANT|nr:ATP synthase F1 subunit epsilon [Xanthomonas populi]PPU97802.1 ATP synthase F1 subunit epsilon [Xanthomonas populi]